MTEREWDRRLHIRSMGREDEDGATYLPYEPTPYAVLERLARSGHVGPDDSLLDYGCGKGRVALFMASVVGCRATGIDRAQKLIDIAEANRLSAGLEDRVTLTCCPAERYQPLDQNVFYFFNPFAEVIFASVLRRLQRHSCALGRPLRVIAYYPSDAYLSLLGAADGARHIGEIDCRDLFRRGDPRERVVIYSIGPDPAR